HETMDREATNSRLISQRILLFINSCLLLQSLQQTCYTYFIGNDIVQFRNSHTLLLHGITITQCYAIVLQSLVVYSDTIWSTDGILTTVTLADAVFLIILAVEMELQVIHNLTRL